MKIEQDYNDQLWNLNEGNKSFSKFLDGTLDFLKPKVKKVVSCTSSNIVSTDSDSDIEYVGSTTQSKTEKSKVSNNETSKINNTIVTTPKNLEINSNVDPKNKHDSELMSLLKSGPKKMTNSVIKHKKHDKTKTIKQFQSQSMKIGRHGKRRKTSSIIEDYRLDYTRNEKALRAKKSTSRKQDSVVSTSRKKDSVVVIDDLSLMGLSSDEDELQEVNTDKVRDSSKTVSSPKPGTSFAITEDLIQSLLVNTIQSDTNHTNTTDGLVNFLDMNKTIEPGTKEPQTNAVSTHRVTKEIVDSLLLNKTGESSAATPGTSHIISTQHKIESLETNLLNETKQSEVTNTSWSPLLYVAKNVGGTLALTPCTVVSCENIDPNTSSTENHQPESTSANVQMSTSVASLITKKTVSILDVDSEESDMNIFFEKLAEYVTNTYPLQKQIDIRSKLCTLASEIEAEDIDQKTLK